MLERRREQARVLERLAVDGHRLARVLHLAQAAEMDAGIRAAGQAVDVLRIDAAVA